MYDELWYLERNVLGLPWSVEDSQPAEAIPLPTKRNEMTLHPSLGFLLGVLQRVDACTDLQGWAQLDVHCTHKMVFF